VEFEFAADFSSAYAEGERLQNFRSYVNWNRAAIFADTVAATQRPTDTPLRLFLHFIDELRNLYQQPRYRIAWDTPRGQRLGAKLALIRQRCEAEHGPVGRVVTAVVRHFVAKATKPSPEGLLTILLTAPWVFECHRRYENRTMHVPHGTSNRDDCAFAVIVGAQAKDPAKQTLDELLAQAERRFAALREQYPRMDPSTVWDCYSRHITSDPRVAARFDERYPPLTWTITTTRSAA